MQIATDSVPPPPPSCRQDLAAAYLATNAPRRRYNLRLVWLPIPILALLLIGSFIPLSCTDRKPPMRPGDAVGRLGDEIVVCGQLFHTTAPVVTWMDPGGYDAYRLERRFAPEPASRPATQRMREVLPVARYNIRDTILTREQFDQVRGGGWPLPLLQEKIDQFVIHYDVAGTSRQCFKALHDGRNLSVHFMLDVDGTIYQTLDLKERAWHAGPANTRSIGIEIANIGAYRPDDPKSPLEEWYQPDDTGRRIVFPAWLKEPGIRTSNFIARPARDQAIVGPIHGRPHRQYDFTPQQYDSLIKLTATLCRVFPHLRCDYPRDAKGRLITGKLSDEQIEAYQGLLGHYHLTLNKVDPGPAFQWDHVVTSARHLMDP